MTYQQNLEKAQQPTFANLFEINAGGEFTHYTNYKQADIVHNNITYKRARIEVEAAKNDIKLTKTERTLKMTLDETMLEFVGNAPVIPIDVKIFGLWIDDDFCQQLFFGEVIDTTIENLSAQVKLEANTAVFRKPYPPVKISPTCNHMVFDPGCKLLEDSFATVGVVTISGNQLISSAFTSPVFPGSLSPPGSFLAEWFINGHVSTIDGKLSVLITNYDGNDTITLASPFPASKVITGSQVKAFPGCARDVNTCILKYDNKINYLGHPFVPNSNPTLSPFKV